MPAMHSNSLLVLNMSNDSCSVDLSIYAPNNDSECIWCEHSLISSESLAYFDTFFKKGFSQYDSSYITIHGIIIKGKYILNENSYDFIFWSPKKNSDGYFFLKEILDVLKEALHTKKSKKYLRVLRKYLK